MNIVPCLVEQYVNVSQSRVWLCIYLVGVNNLDHNLGIIQLIISTKQGLTYCFSYVMCLRNYQKELYISFYCHSHFSYPCSIKSSIFTPNSIEVIEFSSCLKSKKDYCLLLITLYLIVDFNLNYLSHTSSSLWLLSLLPLPSSSTLNISLKY
jgi:hypothetical protein